VGAAARRLTIGRVARYDARMHVLRIVSISLVAAAIGCSSTSDDPDSGVDQTCENISGTVDVEGLAISKPSEDVTACHEVVSTMAGGPPMVCEEKQADLSCVGMTEALGTPIMVTFTGCVVSFGLQTQSDKLTVTALRETRPGGGATDPGYDLNGAPGMQMEKTPDAFLGRQISTTVDAAQCADLGAFSIEGVPTETPLIVRVTDQQLMENERNYVDTYQYNIVLKNSQIRSGPMMTDPLVSDPAATCTAPNLCFVVDEVNTIFLTTFRSVALAAGVSFIPGDDDLYDGSGEGHLAGDVQDCSSLDHVQNAVVGLDTNIRKLAYFNVGFPPDPDNLEDPKVEGSRSRTNADGLYAAIGVAVPPGGKAVKVGAAVTPSVCGADGVCKCGDDGKANPAYTAADTGEGEALSLAARTIFVYPDSITILTFDRNLYTKR
jgi:hypothetical protein